MYDQFKYWLLHYFSNIFEDNVTTHLTASTLTGAVATSLTQPVSRKRIALPTYHNSKNGPFSVGCAQNTTDELA